MSLPDHPTPSEMAATAGDSILDEMRRDPGLRRWFDAMTQYHRDVDAWLATQGFGGKGHVLGDGTVTVFEGDIPTTFRLPLRLRLRSHWIAWRHGGRSLRSRLLAWWGRR